MPVQVTDKIITLSLPSGASTEIYLYGATVTSWKVEGKERLFLSNTAILDGSKAIRGGIPVVWPIFGPPPKTDDLTLEAHSKLSQHGFARTSVWSLGETVMDRDSGVSVKLHLNPTPEIISVFPHPFSLTYVVTLSSHQLSTDLHVTNTYPSGLQSTASAITSAISSISSALPTSLQPSSETTNQAKEVSQAAQEGLLKFQALLHSYIRVDDSSKIKIKGLESGLGYTDKVKGGVKSVWEGGELVIDQEIDRVYKDAKGDFIIENAVDGDKVRVHKKELKDVVTWNPQTKTGSAIGDMEPGGWDHYVCVEPGYVAEFKSIAPGEEWIGQQVLTVEK